MQPSTPAAGGRVRSPPTTALAAEAPPRVGLRGAPSRAARSARSPGRPRSPAAGNSRSSPSSRRSAQSGLPRLPEGEPHAGRPRGPPSPPPHPNPARQPRRAGRGPGRPPLPAPRARRNAWQPRPGAILSGRGAAQPRCFRLFPGPRPALRQPGPSAARGVGGGGVCVSRGGGEEEGRRDPARAPARVQAREAPGGSRDLRSRPGRSGGIINSALGSGGGCGAPATCTPLLGQALTAWALPPQRRTQASLDSATVPQWPITGLDFLTCKLGMCHLALYSSTK